MSTTQILFTMKDLDGTPVPLTRFLISSGRPNTGVIPPEIPVSVEFTTDMEGKAIVSLVSSDVVPYYINKVDFTTENIISYKFFVPASDIPLEGEMLYVDLNKRFKLYNDKSVAALIEAKVTALNARNQVQLYIASHQAMHSDMQEWHTDMTDIADAWLGVKSVAPTLRNDGTALVLGDQYFNSVIKGTFIWNGSNWSAQSNGGVAAFNTFTATNGQTTFTLPVQPYSATAVDVFVNGINQTRDKLTITNTDVVLSEGVDAGDIVEVRVATLSTAGDPLTGNKYTEELTGNGSQTVFTTVNPVDSLGTNVFVNGVYQHRSTYSIANANNITFTEAPGNGIKIELVTTAVTGVYGRSNANVTDYLPVGLGAVATTVQAALNASVNAVKNFNAPTDGVTSASAAFALAAFWANQRGGLILEIPPGDYLLDVPVTFTGSGITLRGAGLGPKGTRIINGTTNTPAIIMGDGTTRYFGCGVSGMTFTQKFGVTSVAGNMGLLVTKQGQCQFSDLATSQYPGQLYEGIVFDDVSQFSKVNIQIQDCKHNGGVLRGCNDAYGVNMRSDANGNDGWLIADTRGLFFTNVTAYTNARYGWNLGTNGINNNTNHFYVNCVGDFSGSNNWQITHLTESVFTSSWASTQNNAAANTFAVGFYLDGTEVRDVLFNGCLALYNNSHGVRVVRATNIKFNDLIAGNTTHGNGRSGAGNGIVVEANAVNVQFNDCNSEWNTNYGYDVSPLATGIRINGGSIASNGSSQFAPGSVQSNCVVKNVSGWNPQMGAITTPAVPASGDTVTNTTGMDCSVHILSGSVSAIYVAGAYAFNQTGVVINLPAGQTIRIDYSSAPLWKWFAI